MNIRVLFILLLFVFEIYANPVVSVIVPVYNTERFLRECLDSILNQTLENIEVVCVNDKSPDNCAKILAEYEKKDPRVVVINFPKNRGASAARNAGLDSAQGDYIVFCDSDDYMHPDMLKILYTEIKKEDGDMAYCHFHCPEESAIPHFEKIPNYDVETHDTAHLIQNIPGNGEYTVIWNKLYKKASMNLVRFDEELSNLEDVYFNFCLSGFIKKYIIVHAWLYYYRQSSNSIVRAPYTHKAINSIRKCIENLQKLETLPKQQLFQTYWGILSHLVHMITTYGLQGDGELFAFLDMINDAYVKNMMPYDRKAFELIRAQIVMRHYNTRSRNKLTSRLGECAERDRVPVER
jgi:glycosyltransferase involved in cell wall biosynthesis